MPILESKKAMDATYMEREKSGRGRGGRRRGGGGGFVYDENSGYEPAPGRGRGDGGGRGRYGAPDILRGHGSPSFALLTHTSNVSTIIIAWASSRVVDGRSNSNGGIYLR